MKRTLGRPFAASLLFCSLVGFGGFLLATAMGNLESARDERVAKAALAASLRARRPLLLRDGSPHPRQSLFVAADSETQAAARVDDLIRSVASNAGASVLSSRAEGKPDRSPVGLRIESQAVIEGNIEALQAILFRLETGAPVLLVNDLSVQPAETSTGGAENREAPLLRAALTLEAFWEGKHR